VNGAPIQIGCNRRMVNADYSRRLMRKSKFSSRGDTCIAPALRPPQTALLKINPRETITTPSFVVQLTVQWLQAQ
jgi:hypothetical protein